MEHNDPAPTEAAAGTAQADQTQAGDEHRARTLLLDLGAAGLDARPWEPGGTPPSAVDLVRFFLWRSGRDHPGGTRSDGTRTDGTRSGGTRPDSPEAARAALTLLPAARAELDGVETALLFTARGAGLTWAQMADALGMNSPQACQQRLDRLLTRRARDDRGRPA
ncbi:DNA-binding protein [Cellulomonas sp. NPDC055163]